MAIQASGVKALVFDVFGTVVDWHGTVAREARALAREKGLRLNAAKFAKAWRAGYRPAMDRVLRGEAPFERIDVIHRAILEDVLKQFRITTLGEEDKAHLNRVWHRLKPWPDAVRGLKRLKSKFVIATLSNGNASLLVDMAKHGGLPWDMVLSAELVEKFKPEPEMYLSAGRLLGLQMNQVMMTAAHLRDLYASREHNMRTGFVRRPLEWGNDGPQEGEPDREKIDVVATSFVDLAEQLGA